MFRVNLLFVCLFFFCLTLYSQDASQEITAFIQSQETSSSVYVLVRHSEKELDQGRDPELSEQGVLRTERLKDMMNPIQWTEIYTSDYKRTRATIDPIATEQMKSSKLYNPRALEEFSESLKKNTEARILIAGHSNSTPSLGNLLCSCNAFIEIDESDYTNIFVVVKNTSGITTHKFKF